MALSLPIPEEPRDLKDFLKKQRSSISSVNDVDLDSLIVWYMNRFPSYLWSFWRDHLVSYGYTWQKFVRVLKYATNDIISWALYDEINWNELISRITRLLERYARV